MGAFEFWRGVEFFDESIFKIGTDFVDTTLRMGLGIGLIVAVEDFFHRPIDQCQDLLIDRFVGIYRKNLSARRSLDEFGKGNITKSPSSVQDGGDQTRHGGFLFDHNLRCRPSITGGEKREYKEKTDQARAQRPFVVRARRSRHSLPMMEWCNEGLEAPLFPDARGNMHVGDDAHLFRKRGGKNVAIAVLARRFDFARGRERTCQGVSPSQEYALEIIERIELIGGATEHVETFLNFYRANRRDKTFGNDAEMNQQRFEDGVLEIFNPLFPEFCFHLVFTWEGRTEIFQRP